jgi:hypothetical protein
MTKLTDQKAFNKAAKHLLTQRKKSQFPYSAGKGVVCAYRGPDGLKCAIGCLIPNKLITDDIETQDIQTALSRSPGIRELFDGCSFGVLDGLQIVHDSFPVGSWAKQLKLLGEKYSLDISVIKKTLDSLKEKRS